MKKPFLFAGSQTVFVLVSVILVLSLGFYLTSIGFLGYEWFSRSGCLVVVLGIWSGVGGLLQEKILTGRLRWRRRNALIRMESRLEAKGADPELIEQEADKIKEAFEKEAVELAHDLRLTLGIKEFTILVTGTLIWGFGDILVNLLLG